MPQCIKLENDCKCYWFWGATVAQTYIDLGLSYDFLMCFNVFYTQFLEYEVCWTYQLYIL